jgi:hypothetical protein
MAAVLARRTVITPIVSELRRVSPHGTRLIAPMAPVRRPVAATRRPIAGAVRDSRRARN